MREAWLPETNSQGDVMEASTNLGGSEDAPKNIRTVFGLSLSTFVRLVRRFLTKSTSMLALLPPMART